MHPIAQALEELFREENWNIQQRDEFNYTFGFRGDNSRYDFMATIGETYNTLSLYANFLLTAPDNKLAEVAEFLHRANYGIVIGNFELDFRDGEIRYKVSTDFEDHIPTSQYISNMISCALAMSERYVMGLGAVIYGNRSPAEVIDEIEGLE